MSAVRPNLCPQLSEDVVSKLRSAGVKTVVDLIKTDLEGLALETSLPYKDLVIIRRLLLAQFSTFPVNCSDFYQTTIASSSIIPTPAEKLNELLDGGLYTSEVTEIAGEISSGKTQFCLSLCVSVVMKARQNVVFIDTCGGFSADRLAEIAESLYGEEHLEHILQSVKVIEAFDIFHLMTALQTIKDKMVKKVDPFYDTLKLLVVDSITAVIYPSLGGQQMDGHGLMVQLSLKLRHLAADFSLCVLVVNNVIGDGKVSLGKTWSHVPHCRLLISHPKDQESNATGGKTKIGITEKGIEDWT
ncbi:DNA repair protein RAD51 homolog 4-like isoform X2 [Crassostrea angulata]|uniref:DNA repair protein RAD51 homolog 4-like isoform X2 n=1 Tax=Magallana angulata TaxID=2784310 RepID=UPI0022B21275|nr:DNA repair protein RAD51 homolog 4-like isoform X2 [Crassostrea angulata]